MDSEVKFGQVVVFDNGGHSLKCGFAGDSEPQLIIPNHIATTAGSGLGGGGNGGLPAVTPVNPSHTGASRGLLGNSCLIGEECYDPKRVGSKDFSHLLYHSPVDRGHITNAPLQAELWAYIFNNDHLDITEKLQESAFFLTTPAFQLPSTSAKIEEIVFEKFGFQAFYSCPASPLAGHSYPLRHPGSNFGKSNVQLIVDIGHSGTTVLPIFDSHVVENGIRRTDIGGKILTNHLKELLTYRSFNLMNSTHIVQQIKEKASFVSLDLKADFAKAQQDYDNGFLSEKTPASTIPISSSSNNNHKGKIFRKYVLPDFKNTDEGYVLESSKGLVNENLKLMQTVPLLTERFCIPECLFRPSMAGFQQGGIIDGKDINTLAY
eukprot:g826.t1